MRTVARRVVAAVMLMASPSAAARAQAPCDYVGPLKDTICGLRTARLEDRDLRPEAFFFEPSKVLLLPHALQGGGDSPSGRQDRLAVEVEFNEPIFPYQHRRSAPDRHFGGRGIAVAFTPMYRVRIWKERSSPVRSPSFMPKATLQLNIFEPRKPGHQWGERKDGSRGFVKLDSVMWTVWGHHSNGQDGCLYADANDQPFPADACPTDPPEIRINRMNGSFSTNYTQVSFFRAYYRVPEESDADAAARSQDDVWGDERTARYSWFTGATYEWNFPFDTFLGGAVAPPVRPIYGMSRVRGLVGFERFPRLHARRSQPRFKASVWGAFIAKKANTADCGKPTQTGQVRECAPRFAFGADLNVGLGSKIDYLGAYARYYHGQDYYNLSFPYLKGNQFQAGLSFTPGRWKAPSFPTLTPRVRAEEQEFDDNHRWDEYKKYVRANAKRDSGNDTRVTPP